MSGSPRTPMKYRIGSLLAQSMLQPLWRKLNALSYWGLGYNNWYSAANGENRFVARWARHWRGAAPIVFDVGANEGDTTIQFLNVLPGAHVHLFEPNPVTYSRLRARFSDSKNIVLNHCGVGNSSGHLTLYDFKGRGSERASFLQESFSELLGAKSAEIRQATVRMVSIDGYCSSHGIESIDFMKVDVEGFEKFVLGGASDLIAARRIGIIQLEINEHNVISGFNIYALRKLLPGYAIFRLLPNGLAPVATKAQSYVAANDIPRYANLVAVRDDLALP